MRDVVVGYCSVTVYFDPLPSTRAWLEEEMRARRRAPSDVDGAADGALIDVPVCYGGELRARISPTSPRSPACSEDDVDRAAHRRATYRVYLVGFVPGFAYMARGRSADRRCRAGRRRGPQVPAGSVAIAGGQTGIYPAVTPGGWNIIGRTPLKPYDPARAEPFLFRPGDRVRFQPIAATEFDELLTVHDRAHRRSRRAC